MKHKNISTLWAAVLIDELTRAGIREVVISPGSRSTPLVLACAAHPDVRDWNVIDERSAGFFALGLARGSNRPVALICTSGTAAANYFPAICEAQASKIPLIVLTADRPAELQNVGASQTMNQNNLYGDKVCWFQHIGQPEATEPKLANLRGLVARAVHTTQEGPVHLNVPFRKPLENTSDGSLRELDPMCRGVLGQPGGQPFLAFQAHEPRETSDGVERLLASAERPIVLAGADCDLRIGAAATRLKIPVLAEATSNLRSIGVIPDFAAKVLAQDSPDLVIVAGRWPIDWPTLTWLDELPDTTRYLWVGDIFANPNQRPGLRVSTESFCAAKNPRDARWSEWVLAQTHAARELAFLVLGETLDSGPLVDGHVAFLLSETSRDDTIVVSSSMPLRDIEMFFDSPARVFSNRGLNGIDGVLSTAAGVAAARGGTTYVLIGDVAFTHDLNGLATVRMVDADIRILLINNQGGAIFDHLPVAQDSPEFKQHFSTPPQIDFALACKTWGVAHTPVESTKELAEAIDQRGPVVVEAHTNATLSRELRDLMLDVPFAEIAPEFEPPETQPPPVIALHGFTGDRTTWTGLAEHLDRPIIGVDLPGHGTCDIEVESMQGCVEYVAQRLQDLGATSCHLIGYSMGGRVALAFAATYPSRVASLITLGASAGIQDGAEREQRRAQDHRRAQEILDGGIHQFVDRWMAHPLFASQQALGPAWHRRSRAQRLGQRAEGLAQALKGYGVGSQPGYWTRLDINAPCLHLAGELDPKYCALAADLAKATGGIATTIAQAGHAAHYEEPEAVAAAINRFWEMST